MKTKRMVKKTRRIRKESIQKQIQMSQKKSQRKRRKKKSETKFSDQKQFKDAKYKFF